VPLWSKICIAYHGTGVECGSKKGEAKGTDRHSQKRHLPSRNLLTFGARGGVYIAGGISPRIVDFMRRSQFRDRFEAKGRFREYLKSIPVHVIMHPGATFIGLNSLLSQGVARMPKGVSFQG
jgi:Glucokinase